MTELRPLAIYPWPVTDADLSPVKAAKAQLDLAFSVVPVEAVPGGPVRVLALRSAPEFLCDYALVRDLANPAAMLAALGWVLDPSLEDPRATLIVDQLRAIFGDELQEISGYDDTTDWGNA